MSGQGLKSHSRIRISLRRWWS